eukprot:TRINITY_DN13392_c0_g1_i2.p1 TRINITY_DN13392_c0_g1~~TRINITY_DN13392_c0_g1_i2.p1  ORF type:complete len:149 (-),score=24.09 TRINITY_DN13392_c0_g1_i2:189-635(-)
MARADFQPSYVRVYLTRSDQNDFRFTFELPDNVNIVEQLSFLALRSMPPLPPSPPEDPTRPVLSSSRLPQWYGWMTDANVPVWVPTDHSEAVKYFTNLTTYRTGHCGEGAGPYAGKKWAFVDSEGLQEKLMQQDMYMYMQFFSGDPKN